MSAAATTTAAAAPSMAGGALEVIFSLALVLGLIFAFAWLARRMQGLRGRAGALSVHAGVSLGPKERVVWLEAGGQHFLLGVGGGGVQLLHRFEQAPEAPPAPPLPELPPFATAFADKLREALGKKAP